MHHPGLGAQGSAVTSTWISPEGAYAFIELRSAEEATNCLRLSGQPLLGQPIRVARPNNYVNNLTTEPLALGPITNMPLAQPLAPGLDAAAAAQAQAQAPVQGLAAPDAGGLPGTELALRVAAESAEPQRCVCVLNFATVQDLEDDNERADLAADLAEECAQFGVVVRAVVPKDQAPSAVDEPPGAFVFFETSAAAIACLQRMQGRVFDGRVLAARYVSDEAVRALGLAPTAENGAAGE